MFSTDQNKLKSLTMIDGKEMRMLGIFRENESFPECLNYIETEA
jgi:hypothetical protein